MNPICSVIIPTINRHQQVMHLVGQLLNQTYPHKEIVVVDQSPEKGGELLHSSDVQYLYLDRPSTPLARNVGVERCRGEIVVFLDDDTEIPDLNLLQKVADAFSDSRFAGLAFSVEDVNAQLNRENQKQGTRIMTVSKSGKVFPRAFGEEQDVVAPRGGGVAFRRSWIVKVGGFDERFVGNAMREETDFSLRVVAAGARIRYKPELRVIHLGLNSGGSRTRDRLQWYKDFFANELLFQLTHFSVWFMPMFFLRKLRPIFACMFWYGKARPAWLLAPMQGFMQGYRRYRKGFTSYAFSR